MKTINETFYKVLQPDGGGMGEVCIARFTAKSEALKCSKKLGKKWPAYVREERVNFTAYATVEEMEEMKMRRDNMAE